MVEGRRLHTGVQPGSRRGRVGPFAFVGAFVDFAGRYAKLGFTEIVIHAPVPDGSPELPAAVADEKLFERNVTQELDQLAGRRAVPGSARTGAAIQSASRPVGQWSSRPVGQSSCLWTRALRQPGRRRNRGGTAAVSQTPLALT